MNFVSLIKTALTLLLALPLLTGCGKKDEHHDDHAGDHGHSHGHGHGGQGEDDHDEHGKEGAAYEEGKGLMLSDEIREFLGLETAIVTAEKLPPELVFLVQIYGETTSDSAPRRLKASGLISTAQGELVRRGQSVSFTNANGEALSGTVARVQPSPALSETELTLELPATPGLKTGDFLPIKLTLASETKALVVPRSALLRAADGDFVYVVNGEAYVRTSVKTGVQTEKLIEITEGLATGNTVVTQPVEMLWLTELRLTKGGGHSH